MLRRPVETIAKLKKFDYWLQFGAVISLAAVCIIYLMQNLGILSSWYFTVTDIETVFSVLAALLFVTIIIIKTIVISSPVERISPRQNDRKAIEMLRNQVRAWMIGQTRHEHERRWRIVCGEDDLAILTKLNLEGFARSSFSAGAEIIQTRNRAIFKKNNTVFSLIYDPIHQENIIGYSCMIPLNQEALELYLRGGFHDKDVGSIHVAGPDEEYAAIVVFAVVMDKQYSQYWRRSGTSYLGSFIGATIDHGAIVGQKLKDGGLYIAQSEKRSVELLLKALYFEKTSFISAEGFPFFRLVKGQLRAKMASDGISLPGVK